MPDFRLDRYTSQDQPNARLRRLRQIDCEKIEAAFDALAGQVSDLAQIVADIQTAQAAADAAQDAATAAARESARISSYPNPGGVLISTDAGDGTATIAIAAHTRVYPVQGAIDVGNVSIAAGTITGQPYSTLLFVYYDDITLANPTPTFVATTSSATAQVGAAAGRHFIGYLTTPAAGGDASDGTGAGPPGGGGGGVGGAIKTDTGS